MVDELAKIPLADGLNELRKTRTDILSKPGNPEASMVRVKSLWESLVDNDVLCHCTGAGCGSFVAPPQAWRYNPELDVVQMFSKDGDVVGNITEEMANAAKFNGTLVEFNDGSRFGGYRYTITITKPRDPDAVPHRANRLDTMVPNPQARRSLRNLVKKYPSINSVPVKHLPLAANPKHELLMMGWSEVGNFIPSDMELLSERIGEKLWDQIDKCLDALKAAYTEGVKGVHADCMVIDEVDLSKVIEDGEPIDRKVFDAGPTTWIDIPHSNDKEGNK